MRITLAPYSSQVYTKLASTFYKKVSRMSFTELLIIVCKKLMYGYQKDAKIYFLRRTMS